MKPLQPSRKSQGSVAIIALLITAIGTVGMMAMLTLVHARSAQVEAEETAVLRHVRQLNGKQLAREYVYQQVLPSSSGAGGTMTISSNWARVTVGSWSDSAFTSSTTGEINPVSLSANGAPYETEVTVEVFSIVDSGSWDTSSATDTYAFRVCGRNPALAGTLFGVQRSGSGASGDNEVGGAITVYGRSFLWESDAALADRTYDFSTEQIHAPFDQAGDSDYVVSEPGVNPATAKLIPDNTPFQAWINYGTAGSVVNDGLLNVVAGPNDNSITSYVTNNYGESVGGTSNYTGTGVSNDGAGITTITLETNGIRHLNLDGSHSAINFQGQADSASEIAASTLTPLVVVVDGTLLQEINFLGNNTRPLILGVRKGFGLGSVDLNFVGADSVRLIMVAEETPMVVDCNGATVSLEGGIITDREFIHNNSGQLDFVEEDSPGSLETIAPRWLWVESYLQPD